MYPFGIQRYEWPAFTLWFTGLPSSGKSTLAAITGAELLRRGRQVRILDADALRRTVCKGLGFSRKDRDENVRRIGSICRILARYDVASLAAVISPYREARDQLRASVPNFVEVYVKAPLSVCVQRDVKGLYAKALMGEISHFTGVDDPYEEPLRPEITVETAKHSIGECCRSVANWLETNGFLKSLPRTESKSDRKFGLSSPQ